MIPQRSSRTIGNLVLQSGAEICGEFSEGSANGGGSLTPIAPISGTAELPHVKLQWPGYAFDGELSADGKTLSGTMTLNGIPSTQVYSFFRRTQ